MLLARSPISGHHQIQRPKSGRKPLHPKNSSPTPSPFKTKPKPKAVDGIEISEIDSSNKENIPPFCFTPVKREAPPVEIESFDVSLAEELTAIREKLERLRIDKDKTDMMLKERGMMFDLQMQELLQRGVLQKHLEIEVDRLYRLKEIKLSCLSISPLRSLREKEKEKKINQDQMKVENLDERKQESSGVQSSDSEVKTK